MAKLFAPEKYWKLSDCERSKVCNGCGTKGLGGLLVPDTLWGLSIEEACDIHDYMYSRGATIADKEEADRTFLNNMVRIIQEDGTGAWPVKQLRLRRAKTYYEAVRIFGGPAFWANKNKPENYNLAAA